jgi:hypothetical protein
LLYWRSWLSNFPDFFNQEKKRTKGQSKK